MLLGVLAPLSYAQMNTEDAIELVRSEAAANRKLIIVANMSLSEEESKIFWPAYKEYRRKVEKVDDRLVSLINKYADNFESLGDSLASEMMIESLDIDEDKLLLKRAYTEELLDILPPSKVAIFFQLENKMDAVVKMELANSIPLAEPKEEQTKE